MSNGNDDKAVAAKRRYRNADQAKRAAADLAMLMNSKLGVHTTGQALRLFLGAHWGKVQALAHAVHDNDDV